jgi:hypothetical protein
MGLSLVPHLRIPPVPNAAVGSFPQRMTRMHAHLTPMLLAIWGEGLWWAHLQRTRVVPNVALSSFHRQRTSLSVCGTPTKPVLQEAGL